MTELQETVDLFERMGVAFQIQAETPHSLDVTVPGEMDQGVAIQQLIPSAHSLTLGQSVMHYDEAGKYLGVYWDETGWFDTRQVA